jgi:hypothetical protein
VRRRGLLTGASNVGGNYGNGNGGGGQHSGGNGTGKGNAGHGNAATLAAPDLAPATAVATRATEMTATAMSVTVAIASTTLAGAAAQTTAIPGIPATATPDQAPAGDRRRRPLLRHWRNPGNGGGEAGAPDLRRHNQQRKCSGPRPRPLGAPGAGMEAGEGRKPRAASPHRFWRMRRGSRRGPWTAGVRVGHYWAAKPLAAISSSAVRPSACKPVRGPTTRSAIYTGLTMARPCHSPEGRRR